MLKDLHTKLEKYSNDLQAKLEMYAETKEKRIEYLRNNSKVLVKGCSEDWLAGLVDSYCDSLSRSAAVMAKSQDPRTGAPSPQAPPLNDRLQEKVNKNTQVAVSAALKMQSIFRSRQAKKILCELKHERKENISAKNSGLN